MFKDDLRPTGRLLFSVGLQGKPSKKNSTGGLVPQPRLKQYNLQACLNKRSVLSGFQDRNEHTDNFPKTNALQCLVHRCFVQKPIPRTWKGLSRYLRVHAMGFMGTPLVKTIVQRGNQSPCSLLKEVEREGGHLQGSKDQGTWPQKKRLEQTETLQPSSLQAPEHEKNRTKDTSNRSCRQHPKHQNTSA